MSDAREATRHQETHKRGGHAGRLASEGRPDSKERTMNVATKLEMQRLKDENAELKAKVKHLEAELAKFKPKAQKPKEPDGK